MKVIAASFLVAFFMIFSVLGIGSWSCNQPQKQNSEQQKYGDAKHYNCTTSYGTVIVGLHDTGDFVHIFHEEIVAVSTVIIAIFTLILGELDRGDGDPYDIPSAQDEKPRIFFNFRVCGRYNCADDDCNKEV